MLFLYRWILMSRLAIPNNRHALLQLKPRIIRNMWQCIIIFQLHDYTHFNIVTKLPKENKCFLTLSTSIKLAIVLI